MNKEDMSFYRRKEWESVSSLCLYSRCPRLYFYRAGCRLSSPGSAIALTFGKAIHQALPYALNNDLLKAMEKFQEVWKGIEGDDKRNSQRAEQMLGYFMATHQEGQSLYVPVSRKELQLSSSLISQEVEKDYEVLWAVDIGQKKLLVGIVDLLGKHRDSGSRWVVEFKTTSMLGSWFFEGLTINPQVTTYPLAMKLMNQPVEGTIVEGILVSKNKCENIAVPFYVNDSLLQQTLAWAQDLMDRIDKSEESGQFPQYCSGCSSYAQFGSPGYLCSYASLCKVDDWKELKSCFETREDEELSPFYKLSKTPVK